MVDQAPSYTDKSVEMKSLNRSRKLISKINALYKELRMELMLLRENWGANFKRLIARPIATLSIEAQERHERDEKIFVDD